MKTIRRLINIPAWIELALYSAISVYIVYLIKADAGVLDSFIPRSCQTGWRSIPFEFAAGWIGISAVTWAIIGSMATLCELVGWFVDPNDLSEERECRTAARWMFGMLSPIGAVVVTVALCALIIVGIPCGVFLWIFRACRPLPAPLPATC
jgi:hypothetical protein